jgi:hypothetical protein
MIGTKTSLGILHRGDMSIFLWDFRLLISALMAGEGAVAFMFSRRSMRESVSMPLLPEIVQIVRYIGVGDGANDAEKGKDVEARLRLTFNLHHVQNVDR